MTAVPCRACSCVGAYDKQSQQYLDAIKLRDLPVAELRKGLEKRQTVRRTLF